MDFKWYTIAAYSGSEGKVADEINKMVSTNSNIKEAFVPTKKVFKILRGKKVEADQKVFPNYVFVNMIADRATLDILRTMPKVMGFLGSNPLKPESVPSARIEKMKKDAQRSVVTEDDKFEIGDTVKIKEGHFESFTGVVEAKDESKNILKIAISIFGRNTIIDIDSSKVERV